MKIGDLVKCTETGRTGIIVEMQRGFDAMLALVSWDPRALWVDVVELEILNPSP